MSKLVTIEFREIDLPAQLADAQANYFAQLLQVGCFGECNATSSEVAATAARLQARWSAAGKTVLLVNASSLDGVNNVLPSASWDVAWVTVACARDADFIARFDQELGSVLEVLEQDTAILILATQPTRLWFVLASPERAFASAQTPIQIGDLEVTLAELTGISTPEGVQGSSLFAQALPVDARADGYSAADEAIVYERLAGLGYIG
jgi:hypothetical protein